jgi:MOSC domain-containing protein YiiM
MSLVTSAGTQQGRVTSLHVHPNESEDVMLSVEQLTLVEGKGIAEDSRYFDRKNRDGQPRKRQVTLIEREQIAEHAAVLGLSGIAPGRVRSNIETEGITLIDCIGRQLQIGEAILSIYAPRTPCHQMDAIASGLRELMKNSRQGVLAQVVRSGVVHVGHKIQTIM